MPNISSLERRFCIADLRAELADPEVWGEHRWRIEHPRSPHRETLDIWVRYNAIENLGPRFNEKHQSVWYPVADRLSSVHTLTKEMMAEVDGRELGGILITRIPPGRQVYPHVDGGWHAGYYEKFAILIQGNRQQAFCFEGLEHRCDAGESFTFRNDVPHWVLNPSDEPRITLIICIRRH